MRRIELAKLHAGAVQDNESVTVAGWIKTLRDSKHVAFIEINDGSCFKGVQIVMNESELAEYGKIVKLGSGAAITVDGVFKLTPDAPQPFEVVARAVYVEGSCESDYPLQKKRHSLEFLRTLPYLRARTNTFNAVFKVRSEAAYAIHNFFHENGFVYIHTPIITGSDCEGAGEMFRVTTLDPKTPPLTEDGKVDFSQDFFGRETNLTVSGQLEAEGFAQSMGKVYTFGPTFRAEHSNTPRHGAEFWMIEPEIAFADLEDDMELAEAMVRSVIKHVLAVCKNELEFFNNFYDKGLTERLTLVANSEFGRVSYTDAIKLLEKNNDNFEYKVEWGCDLQTEHERYLTETVFGKPVFVTDYPKEIKSFYMRLNDDGKTVAATDMLVPGVGELVGGSQREERSDMLLKRIEELGLRREDYEWYIDLRRFGSTKHAGFGLGFERLVMYITGIGNIRDVLPYPRTVGGF